MKMIEACLTLLELGYYEAPFAFEGLADENVWKRPAPGLLSVGELAGHIAYWEASRFAGSCTPPKPDPADCPIKRLLIDTRFHYYTTSVDTTPTPEQLALTAEQVYAEVVRIHKEAVAAMVAL